MPRSPLTSHVTKSTTLARVASRSHRGFPAMQSLTGRRGRTPASLPVARSAHPVDPLQVPGPSARSTRARRRWAAPVLRKLQPLIGGCTAVFGLRTYSECCEAAIKPRSPYRRHGTTHIDDPQRPHLPERRSQPTAPSGSVALLPLARSRSVSSPVQSGECFGDGPLAGGGRPASSDTIAYWVDTRRPPSDCD
jgi:hypothetical protein